MAKIIIANETHCMGCHTCEIACAMAHTEVDSLVEAIQMDSTPQPRVHVEALDTGCMPLQCRHCEDAPCMTVCPTEAIYRETELGPVLLDQDRCIGCKYCMIVCPFGVMEVSPDGKAMTKCDLCIDRTEAGELPACVSACPTHALQFTDMATYLKRRRKAAAARTAESLAQADEVT